MSTVVGGRGREAIELVRAGWDNDATNDRTVTLFDPRAEGLDLSRGSFDAGVIDGYVSARERRNLVLLPKVKALASAAIENTARRQSALANKLGVNAATVSAFTEQVKARAHFQVRMSPDALLSFLSEGRFRTAYEVAVHHDQEPVTDAYRELRAKKEATTGLGRVVYASVAWDAVSRDATAPYGGAVVVLRTDRIADRLTVTERETFAYTDDAKGFRDDVVTWNEVGTVVAHFVANNDEPPGNFERTGSAPHLEAQIRARADGEPIVTVNDVDAVLIPSGREWDAVAEQAKAELAKKGVSPDLVEVVRYTPEVPPEFDASPWL